MRPRFLQRLYRGVLCPVPAEMSDVRQSDWSASRQPAPRNLPQVHSVDVIAGIRGTQNHPDHVHHSQWHSDGQLSPWLYQTFALYSFQHHRCASFILNYAYYILNDSSDRELAFGALTLLVGWQEGHPACTKTRFVGCWRGYLSGVRSRLAYRPADSTATHCLLLQ